MDNGMKENEDALIGRMRKAKRKRIRKNILLCMMLLSMFFILLFHFVIGVAWYRGDTLSPEITGSNGFIYLKFYGRYDRKDIIIFKDTDTGKVLLNKADEFETVWKQDSTKHFKVLGKVILHVPIGGSER